MVILVYSNVYPIGILFGQTWSCHTQICSSPPYLHVSPVLCFHPLTCCRGFPKLGSVLVRSYLPYFVVHTTLVMSDSWIDVCSTAINLIITALLLYLQLWQSKRYASYTRKLSLRRTDEDYRKPMAGLADQRPKRLHRIKSDYLNTAIAWTIIRSQVTFRIGLTLRVQLLKISKKYL